MILMLLFISVFWLGILNLKSVKHLKKELNEELMPIVWDPKRRQNFCISEDEKKEIEPVFTEGLCKCASVVLKHGTKNCIWTFLSDFFGQNI